MADGEDLGSKLLIASGLSSLQMAIESLISAAKTDEGRLKLASLGIVNETLILLLSLPHDRHQLSHLCFKLLRNLCAGNSVNQNDFISLNGVEVVSRFIALEGAGNDPDIIRFGLQVLGNVSLGDEMHKRAVWQGFFPERFLTISKQKRVKICDPLCMVLYNCTDGIPELLNDMQTNSRFPELLREILSTIASVGSEEHWAGLLISAISFKHPHFSRLFLSLCNPPSSNHYTPENSHLLGFVSELLNQQLLKATVFEEFSLSVLEIFKASAEFTSSSKSPLPTGNPETDVLGYSLSILRDICAQDVGTNFKGEDRADIVEKLLSSGLISSLLKVLTDLGPPSTIKKALRQRENQETSDAANVCPYKGFRRDVVGVIANCAYKRRRVQDEIRESNGIVLLLQQCVSDEENPFLREWGIWCVRNLLEGNVENQRIVSELQLQETLNVPELAQMNLKVEIDELTRRAKLVNLPS